MPLDSRETPLEIHEGGLGSLGGCLVEGDREQRGRERRVRRRALVMSVLMQSAVLVLLVLLPLFGKTEHIALGKSYIPIPPFGHPHHSSGTTKVKPDGPTAIDHTFRPPIFGRPVTQSHESDAPVGPPDIGAGRNELASGPECDGCINIGGKNSSPRPPQPVVEKASKPRVIQTTIDPAMLIRRVEPIYPPLARQIHREGRVELRAIIATDGSIQSLEVVGGDPIFYQSALEAVRQWQYKPTILNGQALAIDTHITVIYTVQH